MALCRQCHTTAAERGRSRRWKMERVKKWRKRERKKGKKARKTKVSEVQEIHCVPRKGKMEAKTKA